MAEQSDYKLPEEPQDVKLLLSEASHDRKRLEALAEREKFLATHDELTGLLNRRGLQELLGDSKPPIAVLYIDGTNQKLVNDTFGHDKGDEAIIGTANVIKKSLRPEDIAARIGGDEFLVLLSDRRRESADTVSTTEILERVKKRMAEETQIFLDSKPYLRNVGVKFNIAVGGAVWQKGMSIEDLRTSAEEAMYKDKDLQHESNDTHHS